LRIISQVVQAFGIVRYLIQLFLLLIGICSSFVNSPWKETEKEQLIAMDKHPVNIQKESKMNYPAAEQRGITKE
jgi:hypothetical protein